MLGNDQNLEADLDKSRKTSVSIPRRIWRWVMRGVGAILAVVLVYALCIAIGLIPVNNNFRAPEEGGVAIYVLSGAIHSDLILPTNAQGIDWRLDFPPECFSRAVQAYSYVAIGWGDRGFYLDTPTWSDLTVSTAVRAIFLPSKSVAHVRFQNRPDETVECRRVVLSEAQYLRLVEYIRDSFANDSGDVVPIDGKAYGATDSFYVGAGSYHAFNTCNCWVANGLEHADVRVPWFSPMPRTVLWYLDSAP